MNSIYSPWQVYNEHQKEENSKIILIAIEKSVSDNTNFYEMKYYLVFT